MQPLLQCESKNITQTKCVCVALRTQHTIRMRHSVVCGLPGSTIFLFYIISPTARFLRGGGWSSFIHSFIPLACAEFDDSLPLSGASSFPLCYVLYPATLLHQLFFHPRSPYLAIYFLVYLSILLFPNSYIILFWEFHFLPFSVHVQTNVIYLTLM